MSEKKKEALFNTTDKKIIDDMVDAMKDFKPIRNYDADDVDARIKFYKKYYNDEFHFTEKYSDLIPERFVWLMDYVHWLFVFCFGDMSEDFIKKVEDMKTKNGSDSST